MQEGLLAASASDQTTLGAQSGVTLPLGLRLSASFHRTRTETWVLRGSVQTPIRANSVDWPSLTGAWTLAIPRLGPLRLLRSFTAQLSYRQRESETELSGFGATAGKVTRTRSIDEAFVPALNLAWAGGVTTSLDFSDTRNEQVTAGNLFLTERGVRNASVSFMLRAPARWRLPAPIRGNARYSVTENRVCLQAAGQPTCVPYADSRQAQAEFTLGTDVPPNISAGFQMAYVLSEERQANRKTSQLVITAFVNFRTSVGQLR
jgi:hypothetical protein